MNIKNRSEQYIKFIIYIAVVVLINIAGITLFFRLDLTSNKIYSISNASKKVVSTLSEPLTINVFFTKNLPAPHNNTERYLHDLLEEYALNSNKYFNYKFYDVSPEEEGLSDDSQKNQEIAKNYGIYPVQIQIVEDDEVKFKKAYMGLVIIHGDMIEKIPTITSTDGLEYQLTTAIKKLNNKISALLALKDKINVKLILSSSLETVAPFMGLQELNTLPDKIKNIVKELNNKNYSKLDFEYIDPTKENNLEDISKQFKIMTLNWPAIQQENIQPGQGGIGLVLMHGSKKIEIPLLNVLRIPIIGTKYDLIDLDDLDEIISNNMESLIDINEYIGYLADHGTLSSAPDYSMMQQGGNSEISVFRNLLSQGYSIKDINLKDGNIPDSFKTLIIAGPKEKFTDYELYQIDQALMRGKNLAIFLDSFNEVMPNQQQMYGFNQGPNYIPIKSGLEKLLNHYGVKIRESYVLDESCYKQKMPQRFGGGERVIYFAPIIKNQFIDNDLNFMSNIKGLVMMKNSPLDLDEQKIKANNITAHRLFSSSEQSWEIKDRINLNPMFITPPKSDDKMQSMDLAYLMEGEFSSYFDGKPIPEKEVEKTDPENNDQDSKQEDIKEDSDNTDQIQKDLSKIEEQGAFLAKGKKAKIFIIGSSEILKNTMLDEQGQTPNATFIMNLLDSLNNKEDIAVMRGKEQQFNPLHETDAIIKSGVKIFNIAGLPIMIILFGCFIWIKRRSRRKQIQMMFQK